MGSVVSIASQRPARVYAVYVSHEADGRVSVVIPALADDAKSRATVLRVLRAAIEEIERGL